MPDFYLSAKTSKGYCGPMKRLCR